MSSKPIKDTFTYFGMNVFLPDVLSIEGIKYKVPKYMTEEHCEKYGLTKSDDGEYWILSINTIRNTVQYHYFSDEASATIAQSSLLRAIEIFHSECAEELENFLDS